MRPDVKRVINGTYGSLWVDGDKLAEVETFSAVVNIAYEEQHFSGEGATYQKPMGWSGEGSFTIKKVYSRIQRKLAEEIKRGRYPRSSIVGKLADPDAHGAERVAVYDVTYDSMTLMAFEQKTVATEEVPFKYSDYDFLDLIPGP